MLPSFFFKTSTSGPPSKRHKHAVSRCRQHAAPLLLMAPLETTWRAALRESTAPLGLFFAASCAARPASVCFVPARRSLLKRVGDWGWSEGGGNLRGIPGGDGQISHK
jgi:hypothetical protein